MTADVEQKLPAFFRTQAAIREAIELLRNEGRNSAAEKLGRLALNAGRLSREAIGSQIAAYRLVLQSEYPFPPNDIVAIREKAFELSFDTDLPDGKNTQLKDLHETADDTFVEMEGFVDAIKVIKPPGKTQISRVRLMDASSGITFDAVIRFAILPHAGLTHGSYCRLHGIVKSQSDLNEGTPAIEIDRLALADLAKKSWKIAFLRLAERWFQTWSSGANMYWSIGPHRSQDQQTKTAEGASDLVYPPIVRD